MGQNFNMASSTFLWLSKVLLNPVVVFRCCVFVCSISYLLILNTVLNYIFDVKYLFCGGKQKHVVLNVLSKMTSDSSHMGAT